MANVINSAPAVAWSGSAGPGGAAEWLVGWHMPWYSPKDPTPREQCPCCGYVTLPERGMSLICPVCYWEDDAFVGDRLDERSLCNKMTLCEARSNFAAIGACDRKMLPHVLAVEERGRFAWRPLPAESADA